jgi:hypothetical protein
VVLQGNSFIAKKVALTRVPYRHVQAVAFMSNNNLLGEHGGLLPSEVQQVLTRHEAAGTTDSEEYERAAMRSYEPIIAGSRSLTR